MAGDDRVVTGRPEILRAIAPSVAAVVVGVVGLSDWGGWPRFALVCLAGLGIAAWARWPRIPLLVLTAAVVVPVVLAQSAGRLEPSLFLVSVLALVLGGWATSRTMLGITGAIALATPFVVVGLQSSQDIDPGIWVMGIGLPGLIGLVFRRQEVLTAQLVAARRQLAEQAAVEERRQTAREVHDLVGHGLAAMLLQVTSARHVLRRDVDSAEQALEEAENIGRQSMQELRRTVALLRDSADTTTGGPLPGLGELGALVDSARAGGQQVEFTSAGSSDELPLGIGLAVYRIVQESLVNAARHAPGARNRVAVTQDGAAIEVRVDTFGGSDTGTPKPPGHRGFGVQGMRERAEGAGGTLRAGPTAEGWQVLGRIPLAPDRSPVQAP